MTTFGIDTSQSRLDPITWDSFRTWNGDTKQGGTLTGSLSTFAGRHFLGGDRCRWGHGKVWSFQSQGAPLAQLQPFRAAIICSHTAQEDRKLAPDPHVPAVLIAGTNAS